MRREATEPEASTTINAEFAEHADKRGITKDTKDTNFQICLDSSENVRTRVTTQNPYDVPSAVRARLMSVS